MCGRGSLLSYLSPEKLESQFRRSYPIDKGWESPTNKRFEACLPRKKISITGEVSEFKRMGNLRGVNIANPLLIPSLTLLEGFVRSSGSGDEALSFSILFYTFYEFSHFAGECGKEPTSVLPLKFHRKSYRYREG